jgi:peptidoglycan hydrolase CwlO-like protein
MKTIHYMMGYYEGISGDVVDLDTTNWTSIMHLDHAWGRETGLGLIEDYEIEAKDNQGVVSELESQVSDLQDEVRSFEAELDDCKAELECLRAEVDAIQDELESCQAIIEREKYQ